ncbi:hypothetical protein [Stenotrophomonas sp. Iso1]|uniref:hypothetical protein n=1 Tax=Stenotrophomonas sp. Iso1 TaxID=2977283 RepID=UPI0022B79661|nr:hypothetical protein [Stenotrophomonas sp. Iso1]
MKHASGGGNKSNQGNRAAWLAQLVAIGCAVILASSCSKNDGADRSSGSSTGNTEAPAQTHAEAMALAQAAAADEAVKAGEKAAQEAIARVDAQIAQQSTQVVVERKDDGIGSRDYCSKLAVIAREAFKLKEQGIPMTLVTENVLQGLAHDPVRQRMGIGTVVAIYGDSSLSTEEEAYQAAFDGCSR